MINPRVIPDFLAVPGESVAIPVTFRNGRTSAIAIPVTVTASVLRPGPGGVEDEADVTDDGEGSYHALYHLAGKPEGVYRGRFTATFADGSVSIGPFVIRCRTEISP